MLSYIGSRPLGIALDPESLRDDTLEEKQAVRPDSLFRLLSASRHFSIFITEARQQGDRSCDDGLQ